jgi:hypothetical protein
VDRKTAEQLHEGDRVRRHGDTWIILQRMDRGTGQPHFRLRNERTGQPEGLVSHQYLEAIEE